MSDELMTEKDIHSFGIETVFNYIQKEGYIIDSVNDELGVNPQIVARKNDQLHFIIVRTACYPHKGTIANATMALRCIAQAEKFNAICMFASVGIANAKGTNDEEMSKPVKGNGFYVAYNGLEILSRNSFSGN